jgi:hypothetical protein
MLGSAGAYLLLLFLVDLLRVDMPVAGWFIIGYSLIGLGILLGIRRAVRRNSKPRRSGKDTDKS